MMQAVTIGPSVKMKTGHPPPTQWEKNHKTHFATLLLQIKKSCAIEKRICKAVKVNQNINLKMDEITLKGERYLIGSYVQRNERN